MIKYYTYRLKEEQDEYSKIKIQEVPVSLNDDDIFFVFIAGSLNVLGMYKKEKDYLVLDKKLKGNLKDFYSCFSFITFVNERTYKMFSKRIREIKEEDIEKILKI